MGRCPFGAGVLPWSAAEQMPLGYARPLMVRLKREGCLSGIAAEIDTHAGTKTCHCKSKSRPIKSVDIGKQAETQ